MVMIAHGLVKVNRCISPRRSGQKLLLFFIIITERLELMLSWSLAMIDILSKSDGKAG